MRRRGLQIAALAAVLIPLGVVAASGSTPAALHRVEIPGALGVRPLYDLRAPAPVSWADGSWCWFADPRAIRVRRPRDMTFVGWIDWSGNVTIGAYDQASGARTTYVVGQLYHDDHGSPSILVEPDRRLTVFFSAHNGRELYYRTTLRPEDISAWGPIETVPSQLRGRLGFTYPNPVALPAEHNRMYLFWRGAGWTADYAIRQPDGQWTPSRRLLISRHNRPYVKVDSNDWNTIAFAFTNGHPRDSLSSVYYMAYRGGWLRHADGRRIRRLARSPIRPSQADLVYNARATHVSAWVWDVALTRHGDPVILYATFRNVHNHVYWYARWTGRRWVSHFLTFAGPSISPGTRERQYSGGMALDHDNPSVVYLSRRVRGWFEIERWVTRDGGRTWRHRVVVRTPGADDVRPVVTRNSAGGPVTLLWLSGHYGTYKNYRTMVDYLP